MRIINMQIEVQKFTGGGYEDRHVTFLHGPGGPLPDQMEFSVGTRVKSIPAGNKSSPLNPLDMAPSRA